MTKTDQENKRDRLGDDSASPFPQPVEIPLRDALDLHPFQPGDIPSVVEEYLKQCVEAGLQQVRLIHGKGLGVQRDIVRRFLQKHPAVASFHDAPPEVGGWGATIVVLRRES